jgi:tetratricopeptide (TPR) repeat protein
MQRDPRTRGAATGFTFETALENEGEILDGLLAALARNQIPAGTWSSLHLAAVRDDRLTHLAEAYATVSQGKRLKAAPPQVIAEFLYRAGLFSADAANDAPRSVDYWQRALVAFPAHPAAFGRLESVLVEAGDRRGQADLYIAQAHHRPRAEQADFLRRAATLLEEQGGESDLLTEQYQEILRLDPRDDETREKLSASYMSANRPRDVVRLLEQALTGEPAPSAESAREIRTRLIQLYAGPLKELERTMPHVEALLAADPEHDEARALAKRLLEVKALAGRAAAALALATEATGTPADVVKILAIELEHTRGPKRRDVLRRLGILRQDGVGDEAGAYEAFEQALALDATDDEVLQRYTQLAGSLHKELDAGRSLARFGAAARDPQVRARLSAAVGVLYLSGGDAKRARAAFVSVLAMPDLPGDVALGVSRSLCAIYASERDFRSLADALERVALLEPNPDQRQTANEELAELAQLTLRDAARSISAWRRLVDTPARARALAALEPLYAATGNAVDLAFVLEERAKDEPDDHAARALAFRAAEVLTSKGGDRGLASEAWARFSQRFGADRDALAAWIPLLEAEGDWVRLSMAVEGEASLAPDDERAALFVKLGQIRLQRTHDVPGAIEAFAQALAADPTEPTSRATLEKLAAAGGERLAAALVLEPYYRHEQHAAGVLRVLDLKATLCEVADERTAAIEEALGMTEQTDTARAADWTARGLREAVSAKHGVGGWIDRLARALATTKPRSLAPILAAALGELAIDSAERLLLARRAAEAHVANADVAAALALYRRALVYDAESPELLGRVDELLQEQGTAAERIAIYRSALEKNPAPARRRTLMHTVASIERRDLNDPAAAIATYEVAVADDAADRDAVAALAELYAETEQWDTLLALLERSLATASEDDARGIRARTSEVAAKRGDLVRARAYADALLSDDALTEADLIVLERVASALEDTTMLRAVLARRAALAADPASQVEWLDRLAALELSCAAPDLAVATWKRAAAIAETNGGGEARRLYERVRDVSPNDGEAALRLAEILERAEEWPKLPELYAVMLEHSEHTAARIGVLMRHARLLAERLDDPASALISAAQAFELASGAPEYPDVLSTFTLLALRGKATHIFAQAMDDAVEKNAGADLDRGQRRAELRMAKARVLAANRDGRDAAISAYRAILEDPDTPEAPIKTALHAFESLLSSEAADARRTDRRWLLSWRAEHAVGPEKAAALETWASTEDAVFGDSDRALELYRRVLELDPEHVSVLGAVARLSLNKGDAEGAVIALAAQRDRSEGPARRAVELEIASTLLHRLARPAEALVAVSRVLEDAPDDPTALTLATALIADASTRDAMAKVLETTERETRDPAIRAGILRTLLDATGDGAATPEVRGRWFGALYELQRAEGRADLAFETALAATHEQPELAEFWGHVEQLARDLDRPREVADAYTRALAGSLAPEIATTLGERAVAFQEEWFEDISGVVRILERVLVIDPHADWAFDRLKLVFDSGERWTELFALYDRTILAADDARKATLYEDAAQIAKDFANDSDRAVGYLEKLLVLRPADAHLVASLERLYERKGAYRELVALLSRQLESQKPADAQRTRARVAQLWLDELADPTAALLVADEMRRNAPPSAEAGPNEVDPFTLIERVMTGAPRGRAADGGETPVRYRAAAILREHYERAGRDADLARFLEVELEITTDPDHLAKGHRRIATFRAKLGDDASAMEHVAALVVLEPDTAAHRTELAELAARVGRYDRLADVLAQAGEKTKSEVLRAELMVAAGDVWVTHLGDEERALRVYLEVLAAKATAPALVLETARKVEPLLERASRAWDLLEVLERLASVEDSSVARARAWTLAARLAMSLGDHARAISAWEARLKEGSDGEALDALIDLLEREGRWQDLLIALRQRVATPRPGDERHADRARIARVQQDRIGDLDAAVAEWTATEAEFGPTDESTDALCRLLEKTERWTDLEQKLEAAAARAPTTERRAALHARLGDVARLHRDDPERARTSYDAALAASPLEPVARAGLLAMANADVRRPDALQTLLTAFSATDDWQETLGLTPLRLLAAESDGARVRVLLESAKLAEERGDDATRAFSFDVRAFLLAPDHTDVAAELTRLAAKTSAWQPLADAHEEVLANTSLRNERSTTLGDPVWRAGFRFRLGRIKDDHLDDTAGALREYEAASKESPADVAIALAAIDVAARLSLWDAIAGAVVRVSRGLGVASEEALTSVERAAQASHAWDALTVSLAGELESATDLAPKIARDLEARLGVWHRDRRGDPDAAELAFARALAHDDSNTELLTSLARIQRRAKGRPLVDSLLRLSQATGGDLELLREAAEVAITTLADRGLARSILGAAIALAETRWASTSRVEVAAGADVDAAPVSVGATISPAPIVRWAVAELARIHEDDGHPDKTVDLLTATARLPWEADEARRMLHDAARIARDGMHDDGRATHLYEGLFDSDPGDLAATSALVALYETHEKLAELLRLYERLVERATDPLERVRVRLASAKLELALGHPDAAIKLLRSNLADAGRHLETVAELVTVLGSNARFAELVDLDASQAELAETDADSAAATTFWLRAAEGAETRLSDAERAVRYHRRVLPLDENVGSLDALARLLSGRGDYAGAADMLERLIARAPDETRTTLTLRLIDALVSAGDAPRARQELEAATAARPDDEALAGRLVAMYEEQGAWEALAELHRASAERATDKGAKLSHLRAAAELFTRRSATPEAAIPLLEQSAVLEPEDRSIRLALADALVQSTRYPEARAVLRAVVDGFGGRRPKERGVAHYHLAQLEIAVGNRAQALVELDAATKIDPGNARILRALAELARDDGQIDRAERSYRALLVALKRPEESTDDFPIVRSEVLLELSLIAAGQGQADRSRELVESALESASKNVVEGRRLERALREKKDFPTLVRALEARLARSATDGDRVEVLTELARVLDVELGHLASAFATRQRVLALTPTSPAAHEACLSLARRVDGVARYLADLDSVAASEEKQGRHETASALYLRLGQALEAEQADDARVLAALEQSLAVVTVDALPDSSSTPSRRGPTSRQALLAIRALDPVYTRLGRTEARGRLLARRVEIESIEDDPKSAADARYGLAELMLATPEGALEAGRLVTEALGLDHDLDRAESVVRGGMKQHASDEGLLDLFERIGRNPGREAALLDALERRAELPSASTDVAREAATIAKQLGMTDRAEAVLTKYVARGQGEDVAWAFEELANLREAAGDATATIEWKKRAAEVAVSGEARRLRFEIAKLSLEALEDAASAATMYEALFDEDPTDRAAWEPMLATYRTMADARSLVRLLARVAEQASSDEERTRLRFERVRLMVDSLGEGEDAIAPLSDLVADDPNFAEAALLLADLLEKSGNTDDLRELLARQIDAAKDRQDAKVVEALSLRRAKLLETDDADEARATLYSALDWTPESLPVLRHLERLLEGEGMAEERLDVKERILPLVPAADAEAAALALAELRIAEGNADAAERALEVGFRVNPASRVLRDRLETTYREADATSKLADLYAIEAQTLVDPAARVARLREVAALYTNIPDARRAADTLAQAFALAKHDLALASDLAAALAAANDLPAAIATFDTALEGVTDDASQRAALLLERANLRVALDDDQGAAADLIAVARLGVINVSQALGVELERVRARADARGDAAVERTMRLELATVRAEAGDLDAARPLVSELLRREPKDREALRLIARIEERAERWDAATVAYRRLIPLEEGDLAVDTALRLADACERAGRLGDARGALERARTSAPQDQALRLRLERLYESVGAFRELAEMSLQDAREASDDATRCEHLKRAGSLLLQDGTDPDAAIDTLANAHALGSSDVECSLLLADAYTVAGRTDEAREIIAAQVTARAGRRSPELASLYHRLARIANASGDRAGELGALTSGLEADAQNGFVAAELASLALEMGDVDIATRALRSITLLKDPSTSHLPRGLAYQYLGEIARQQGDAKRAMLLLKRALEDDPSLDAARSLIEELRAQGL